MIDYRQRGFDHPAFALDPIPTVAEYLNNYRQLNEDWYASFAYPLEGGGWGARPSSFVRRGAPDPNAQPSQVDPDPAALPPILQDVPPEDTSILAGDRPLGALVRDVTTMTDDEMMAEGAFLAGPGGYTGNVAAMAVAPAGGSLPFGLAARAGVADRLEDLALEALIRSMPDIPGQDRDDLPAELPTITRVGTPTVTEARETGSHQGGGPQDYERGGEDEFDAGGWRGGGGL